VKRAATPGDVNETALTHALHTWPDIRRTERDWAEFAECTQSDLRVRHAANSLQSISDEDLLSSPLPQADEEGHKCRASSGEIRRVGEVNRTNEAARESSRESPDAEDGIMGQQQSQRGGDRRSFRDLAELAGTPHVKRGSISEIRTKTTANDSGMIDLEALASSDPGAVDRASVTPLASETLFDGGEDPPTAPRISVTPGSVAPSTTSPLVIATPRVVSAQATLRSSEGAQASRGKFGRVAAVVGLAAIAAGAFFAVRTLRPAQAPTTSAVQVVDAVQAAPQAPVAVAQAPVPAANPGVDPMDLPHAGTIVTTAPIVPASRRTPHVAAAQAPVATTPDTTVASSAPAKPAPKAAAKVAAKEAPPSAALTGALGAAIMQSMNAQPAAAPAADTPAAPVAQALAAPVPASAPVGASGSLSQRPSQGAVTSALGGVLPNARKCLGPDDGVSRAHVVFGSAGSVQSIDVSGFSAGKPSEACIKGALGKAQVPAFAESSYGATVTIRP
jgi:hypothetical protein